MLLQARSAEGSGAAADRSAYTYFEISLDRISGRYTREEAGASRPDGDTQGIPTLELH